MQDHTVNKRQPAGADCLKSLYFFYFAYSVARLSRMTLTLIWPG